MKFFTDLGLAIVLVVLVSFTAAAQITHPYFPVATGNTYDWDSDIMPFTETIVSESQQGGLTWYKYDTFWRWTDTEVAVDLQGDLYVKRNGVMHLWIKLDAPRGDTWTAEMPGSESWTAKMVDRNLTLTTISGTFHDVLQIDFIWQGADNDLTVYYAPGYGPVKRILKGFGVLTDELLTSTTGVDSPESLVPSMTITDLYPQPAVSSVQVQFGANAIAEDASYNVRDALGREVMRGAVSSSVISGGTLQLPTATLRSGAYFLSVANRSGISTARFVVK